MQSREFSSSASGINMLPGPRVAGKLLKQSYMDHALFASLKGRRFSD